MTVTISNVDDYKDALAQAHLHLQGHGNPRTFKMRVHTFRKNGVLHRVFKFTKKRHTK